MKNSPVRGSTKDLLYWQAVWFVRFVRTWFHIIYRPAYHSWKKRQAEERIERIERLFNDPINRAIAGMDEGFGVWGDSKYRDL